MNDKDFKDCMNKLVEATNSLSDVTEKLGKTIDKMIDYCIIVSLVMLVTVITVIVF